MNSHIRKAEQGVILNGSLQNQSNRGRNRNGIDVSNYRHFRHSGQCKKCRSDYMKYSYDDYCQDCQQRVEFIRREHPEILTQAANKSRGYAI